MSLQKVEYKTLLNQLKLKVKDTFKKDEKISMKIEPSNDEDVMNKAYIDTKLSKI